MIPIYYSFTYKNYYVLLPTLFVFGGVQFVSKWILIALRYWNQCVQQSSPPSQPDNNSR